ncbi:glycoside hydrolase family 17 protein [Rhodanobacter lindaniclasticus]
MSSKAAPVLSRKSLAWLVLLLAALAAVYGWWAIGRPVNLPDAPTSRIACVSYAPFRNAGESPLDAAAFVSAERVDADLRALSRRFDCVRTYSQGQGLGAVPQIARRYGMKVLLGIWLGHDPKANAEQIRLGIAAARAYPDVVRAVIVGNEVLLRGELSSAQLAADLAQVRAAVPEPVTYADVWEFWLRHPELANSVDYLTIHILPYWEDQPVPPEQAVQHVAAVYAKVQQAFPGKRVMIGETGWPSAGRPRQGASASVVDEARYLRDFLRYAAETGLPYNVIEAFDQPWKRALEGTVGGYWGIFDAQARPKFAMTGPVVEMTRWWLGWLAAALGGIVFVLAGAWRRRRGWREPLALGLAGVASGAAIAWQFRQMWFACRNPWEWTVSLAACLLAVFTALRLARWIAGWLAGAPRPGGPGGWRTLWLFALAYYGLLLVFDGRYRDFPLGLFALPCVGHALVAWLSDARTTRPALEQCFLAACLPLLGVTVVIQEAGLNPTAWSWLALNLLLAWPVWHAWRVSVGLQAQQA